jgi:hypothetical protein
VEDYEIIKLGEGGARWESFKRLYKEVNKMEYPEKYLFMTFDC